MATKTAALVTRCEALLRECKRRLGAGADEEMRLKAQLLAGKLSLLQARLQKEAEDVPTCSEGLYVPRPEEEPRPMMPFPPGVHHPPLQEPFAFAGPWMSLPSPVPSGPGPALHVCLVLLPPAMPPPCEPTPGPSPEEPRGHMMPALCEPNPQYYRHQAHDATQGQTMPPPGTMLPTPFMAVPCALPPPCGPTPGYCHPLFEDPWGFMMPLPCEPSVPPPPVPPPPCWPPLLGPTAPTPPAPQHHPGFYHPPREDSSSF
ncbi:unnamed protein product [Symbiodinium sp. CCMP2592]|nr:unnamed protein product [Symbiodinium sp. CCMP2592]